MIAKRFIDGGICSMVILWMAICPQRDTFRHDERRDAFSHQRAKHLERVTGQAQPALLQQRDLPFRQRVDFGLKPCRPAVTFVTTRQYTIPDRLQQVWASIGLAHVGMDRHVAPKDVFVSVQQQDFRHPYHTPVV